MVSRQEFKQKEIGMIPTEWRVVQIEEISKVRRGASPRPIGDSSYFSDNGRGWIRISDVTDTYKYLRKTSQYLSKKGEEKSVKVNPGDLIMSICATIGKPIILDMEACIHDGFVWFSELSSKVNVEYLFYVLQKNEITFSSKRQTGTQGNLNTTLVGKTLISLPPLPEQQKIAEILSTVDMAIEKADEAIEKTQRVKKGLMQELLTGRRQTVDSKQGKRKREFKETEIGRIPKEWQLMRLDELGDNDNAIVAGPFGSNLKVSDYKSSGIPIIRLQNIERNQFITKDIKYISNEKAKELNYHSYRPGDLILAKLGDPIGKTCIIPPCVKAGIVVADVVRIRLSLQKVTIRFVEYMLNSSICFKQLQKETIGSTRPRVNITQVRNLKLPIPTLPEQQKIAEILSTVDTRLGILRKRKEKMERIKKGLMNDLLTGKKRVKR